MANQRNKDLFSLMDELDEHKEKLDHFAINRTKSGNRIPNRLEHIEKHASDIEAIAKAIQAQVLVMRKR